MDVKVIPWKCVKLHPFRALKCKEKTSQLASAFGQRIVDHLIKGARACVNAHRQRRKRETEKGRHIGRRIDRQTDRPTDRQTDRPTDR